MKTPPIFLFGRHCSSTATTLGRLVDAQIPVAAIVVATQRPGIRVVQSPEAAPRIPIVPMRDAPSVLPNVASLAWSAGSALIETDSANIDSIPERFSKLSRSIIVSSCFPWKLPETVLSRSRFLPFNVHPSLLPRHRGPEPLFWTFWHGDSVTGATVHKLTDQFDAGSIISSATLRIEMGMRYSALQDALDLLGADLLVEVLQGRPESLSSTVEQEDSDATRAPLPCREDLVISLNWDSSRAYRFARGVGTAFGTVNISVPRDEMIPVVDAIAIHPDKHQPSVVERRGHMLSVQFGDGIVDFLADHASG